MLYKALDNEDGTLSWSWARDLLEKRIETCKENDAREAEVEARVEALVQQRLAQLENGVAQPMADAEL